jgi:hypothetical protein
VHKRLERRTNTGNDTALYNSEKDTKSEETTSVRDVRSTDGDHAEADAKLQGEAKGVVSMSHS